MLETYAKQARDYTTTPSPGDVAFMDLTDHGGTVDGLSFPATHVGIVESVNGSNVTTIEGNAANSGVVTVHTHTIGQYLYAFGRWPAP